MVHNGNEMVIFRGLPKWCRGKDPPANAGDTSDADSSAGSGRYPGDAKWQSSPVFSPEKFHGQESGMLKSMGSQSWTHDLATEQQ